MIVNTLAPPTPSSKPTKVNLTTIPNPNRLLAALIIVDEGEGRDSELRSNEQDYSGFSPSWEYYRKIVYQIFSLVPLS